MWAIRLIFLIKFGPFEERTLSCAYVKSSKSKPSFTLCRAWTSSRLLFTAHNTIQVRDLTMSIKHMSVELSVHKMYHDGVHHGHNKLDIYIYIYSFLFYYFPYHKVLHLSPLHLVYICSIKSHKTWYIQCSTVFYEHGKTKYGMPCWFCFFLKECHTLVSYIIMFTTL
jgi:hypothetical protein